MSEEAPTTQHDGEAREPVGELPDADLEQAAGGAPRKSGGAQQEYLVVKMEDVLIS